MVFHLTALGIVFLVLYNVAHLLISRIANPVHRWRAMKRLYFLFIPVVAICGYFTAKLSDYGTGGAPAVLATGLTVWLIHVGYLTVYSFIDRSITLRTFIEISAFKGQPATLAEIEMRYNPTDAFERRLSILLNAGYLKEDARGRLVLTGKGLRTARLIKFLKEIYRAGPGG